MTIFPALYILEPPYGQFQGFTRLAGSLESVSCFLQSSVDNTVHQSDFLQQKSSAFLVC